MNIYIKQIKEKGNLHDERLVLRVQGDDDIGRYVVFATKRGEDGYATNHVQRAYWFPDATVAEGDLVILYTRAGEPKEKKNPDGSKSHFFYWELETPIWGQPDDCAVLLQAKDWAALEPTSS